MNSLYKSPPGATNPRRETERERERERSPRCCGWFPSIISTPQQSATRLPLIHHASIVARQVRRRTTPSSMSPFFLRGFNSQLATSISSTSCQPPVRETKESKGIPQINHPARPRASCFVLRERDEHGTEQKRTHAPRATRTRPSPQMQIPSRLECTIPQSPARSPFPPRPPSSVPPPPRPGAP